MSLSVAFHSRSFKKLYSDLSNPALELLRCNLHVNLTNKPRLKVPNKDLVFGKTFSDHMLIASWNRSIGWSSPSILPYGPVSLEPSASVFHYGIECFEGLKAYKDNSGKIRLFRPDMNMNRFRSSCERLGLPSFHEDEMLKCIKELIIVDSHWIPQEKGYSLYVRPTMIGTQQSLGVAPSSDAMLMVITSPVGPYYKTGFSAVNLLAEETYVRAWPGGTGCYKIGGNYAPGIIPQMKAAAQNFQQILWLFGNDHYLTEVGTMNCFVFWINENGEKELITPPLDGCILPGVTRDSILQLAKQWNEFKVSEKPITMQQILKAKQENRLLEMFGSGTAAIVSPIKNINYKSQNISIPLDATDPNGQAGPLAKRISTEILSIQYGEKGNHEWSSII